MHHLARRFLPAALFLLLLAGRTFAAPPGPGYHAKVAVSAPTRLDWIFALANQSLAEPPGDWLGGYDSTAQHYALYVPPDDAPGDADHGRPLVLFINAGDGPGGFDAWQGVCRQKGMLFAAPYGVGNRTDMPRRVRIALDVLDDLRRNYEIDPDRTYVAGFSGGGRVACGIAFALPELFGGVVPVCAGGELRDESWLRARVLDRLSIALVTGETDFNRGEVERFRTTYFQTLGARVRTWVVPKMGHALPRGDVLAEVHAWLDEAAADRRKLAEEHPASRIDAGAAPSRKAWAESLLAEGNRRLEDPETLYSGLMQLKGVAARWPDLPAADRARRTLAQYDAREDRPWDKDDVAEQLRFLVAQARGLDAYATGPLAKPYEKIRGDIAAAALERWQFIRKNVPADSPLGREAADRIPELEKRATPPDKKGS